MLLVTGSAGFIGNHLVEEFVPISRRIVIIDDLSIGKLTNLKKSLNLKMSVF